MNARTTMIVANNSPAKGGQMVVQNTTTSNTALTGAMFTLSPNRSDRYGSLESKSIRRFKIPSPEVQLLLMEQFQVSFMEIIPQLQFPV